jgi:hypothetical protein
MAIVRPLAVPTTFSKDCGSSCFDRQLKGSSAADHWLALMSGLLARAHALAECRLAWWAEVNQISLVTAGMTCNYALGAVSQLLLNDQMQGGNLFAHIA